jgi:prepilin-type N-terminal cleavage/methylation domain-containing protein
LDVEREAGSMNEINKKRKRGFTLIEVILALALLGLLTVSVLPWFGESFKKLNQASELVKADYTSQQIISNVRINPNYDVPDDSGLELTKSITHYVVDGTTIYYEGEDGYQDAVDKGLIPEEGMKVDVSRKSDGSLFMSTFIRSKALSVPVRVIDTTSNFIGDGVQGVKVGLYKRDRSSGLRHELVATQTTNESGNAFFILPLDYGKEEYVVMFPTDQYKAYYRYSSYLGSDGSRGAYQIRHRNDTQTGEFSQIVSNVSNNLWGNSANMKVYNRDSTGGSIICETITTNSNETYLFDSDTLLGETGDERNNFDDGNAGFRGLVEVENGRVNKIEYVVRQPVNVRLSSNNNRITTIWVTNYNHYGDTISGTASIPFLWPRLEAYNEYKYWAKINSDQITTMRFVFSNGSYTFSRDANIGTISVDGKTWTTNSTTWQIID